MNVHDLFPSKWIKASDLQGQAVPVVIRAVGLEEFDEGETKPAIYFEGHTRGMLLNKTNARIIAALYGPETDNWKGRPITIYPTQTDFKGAPVECVRVKQEAPPDDAVQQAIPQRTPDPVIVPPSTPQTQAAPVNGREQPQHETGGTVQF